MTKQTPSDILAALEEQRLDDEMEAVLAMTPEERRRELREAGFDLDRVHADADALLRRVAPAPTATVPRARRGVRIGAALSVAGALAAGAAVVAQVFPLDGPIVTRPAPDDAAKAHAGALRLQAREAYRAGDSPACLAKLNEARRLDPTGDGSPEVQSLRRSAAEPPRQP